MDRLAMNAMLARQAGMSYGKWKALQPVVVVKNPEIPDGYQKCEWCGNAFKKMNGKRFCNDDCRIAAYVEKKRRRAAEYMRRYRAEKRSEQDG